MSSGTLDANVITLETKLDGHASPAALGTLLPAARLVEVSGQHACARTTTAVSCVIHAQSRGDLVAWVQPRDGALFPPDLAVAGVDLDALVAIHVPRHDGPLALVRAAEWLARSGAFGLTVIDLTDSTPSGSSASWQGRLQGVLRQYDGRILLLTSSFDHEPSSGPLVGLRVEPQRGSFRHGHFEVKPRILKDKVGLINPIGATRPMAPAGLRGAL
ncbi:MAG: recombinase A [Myxococcota bacterium]